MDKGWLQKTIIIFFITLACVVFFFPLLFTFFMSLKPYMQLFEEPTAFFVPTLKNYINAFGQRDDFFRALTNSLVISSATTILAIVFGSPLAYWLSRTQFRGKNLIAVAILMIRMIPMVSLALPIYLLADNLGILDTHLVMILAHTSITMPLIVWVMRGFFFTIPVELEESAVIDGCSRLRAFISVIMPLTLPGLAATSIFGFLSSWNDLGYALILGTFNAKTLPVSVQGFVTPIGTLWGEIFAGSVIIVAPVFIFILLVQKHFIRGLTMGAVKG